MEILKIPNPILLEKSEDVTDFHPLSDIFYDMVELAEENRLIGLAASQVGILQKFFIINLSSVIEGEKSQWKMFVNPVFAPKQSKGKNWAYEGCASIPNRLGLVERWTEIVIKAQSINGEYFNLTLTGFLARVYQHEKNHNDGILLTSPKIVRQWKFLQA